MPSKKTLFEFLSNRFLSSQLNSKEKVKNPNLTFKESTLFIMTNEKTNSEIENFFKENNYFHLKKENIIFFPQTEICALDLNGKVISLSPSNLYQAPDGNGGCFTAMKNNKIIDICLERKIEFINVTSIDNPLYKVLDPLFIGLTYLKGLSGIDQMSAKFIKKTDPEQKCGNFLIYKNKPLMLDYMEIPNELKYKKRDNGDLFYNTCNILDYLISVNFLKKVLLDDEKMKVLISEFHILKKKFNCCYFNKEKNDFEVINNKDGLKFEIFFNSIFEFAEKEGLLLFETEEKNEFSPVKNHDGEKSNTPSLTRIKMSNVFKKWFKENGGEILNDDENKILEISFLNSYDGKNLFDNTEIPKKIDMKDVKDGIYFKNSKIEN
jgi:UDP-N-acetylglucosamine/UDP-N-acetylgalactosamine diphosphorylase